MTRLTEQQEQLYLKTEEWIVNFPCGEEKQLDKNHAGYDNFVSCCKFMIDNAEDWSRGFSLVFNTDYSKIRKDERCNFVIPKTK